MAADVLLALRSSLGMKMHYSVQDGFQVKMPGPLRSFTKACARRSSSYISGILALLCRRPQGTHPLGSSLLLGINHEQPHTRAPLEPPHEGPGSCTHCSGQPSRWKCVKPYKHTRARRALPSGGFCVSSVTTLTCWDGCALSLGTVLGAAGVTSRRMQGSRGHTQMGLGPETHEHPGAERCPGGDAFRSAWKEGRPGWKEGHWAGGKGE